MKVTISMITLILSGYNTHSVITYSSAGRVKYVIVRVDYTTPPNLNKHRTSV